MQNIKPLKAEVVNVQIRTLRKRDDGDFSIVFAHDAGNAFADADDLHHESMF